jgi:hypothetical protein
MFFISMYIEMDGAAVKPDIVLEITSGARRRLSGQVDIREQRREY